MQFEQYTAGFPDGQITVKYRYRSQSSEWHFLLQQPLQALLTNADHTVALQFKDHLQEEFQVWKNNFKKR